MISDKAPDKSEASLWQSGTLVQNLSLPLVQSRVPEPEQPTPLGERPEATLARVERLSLARKQAEALEQLETGIMGSALEVLDAALSFGDLDPAAIDNIPEEWVEQLGVHAAAKKHRVAKGAWLAGREAPYGIVLAERVIATMLRSRDARAMSGSGARALNVAVVNMPAPAVSSMAILEEKGNG